MSQKFFNLVDGSSIPALGLGTWQIPPDLASAAVQSAVEIGYRHIDCALIYGNEMGIGVGLSEAFHKGLVRREELWITSKLWNHSHRREQVRPALEQTLSDLQLNYLDLYLIHWPVVHQPEVIRPETPAGFVPLDAVPLEETWQALGDCLRAGLCRHIGVANFSTRKLEGLIQATGVVPEVNQVELHPYLQQSNLVEYCQKRGILLTAYSPLGSPKRPDLMRGAHEPSLLTDPKIVEIAASLSATPSQVLLAWAIQRGTIPIPKSATPAHQRENFAAQSLTLDHKAMELIARLDRQQRYIHGRFWVIPGSPYTLENLWDE